jgi:probable rRNA maturation factor
MTLGTTRYGQGSGEFDIALVNEQLLHPVNDAQLCEAARAVLREAGFASAAISIAVVDDSSIHELNRRYLEHDWPTDVLSFVLDERGDHLEGEVIISADTAARAAAEVGWPAAAEQLLYVVHGMLHLVGYRDKTPADLQKMRAAEAKYLQQFRFQLSPRASDSAAPNAVASHPLPGGATAR